MTGSGGVWVEGEMTLARFVDDLMAEHIDEAVGLIVAIIEQRRCRHRVEKGTLGRVFSWGGLGTPRFSASHESRVY